MLNLAFLSALLKLTLPLNCLKQTFPQFYFAEMPVYFEKDKVTLEITTLIHLQGTNNLLLAGTHMRKIKNGKEEEIIAKALFFRVLDNGANDNIKFLDYSEDITRMEQTEELVYLFTRNKLTLSYLRRQMDRLFIQKYFEIDETKSG